MKKRVYLDYAATTPLDARVKKAMEPYLSGVFGNPGSLHWFGQEASAAVFKARRVIAEAIGADYSEVIFTGSATEANNLAIRGVYNLKIKNFRPRIIVSAIEHDSVLETCKDLEKEGVEVVYLPVSREGIVDLKKLEAALNERTILVSVMYANNEIGTVQPISEISEIIKNFKKTKDSVDYPLFHIDAVQAFQYLDCDVNKLGVDPVRNETTKSSAHEISNGVDLMTLSAHKIYGLKGVGALYVRKGFRENTDLKKNSLNTSRYSLYPIIVGGGQEWGLRSGTENVAGIVGFAKAVEIVEEIREKETKRVEGLRDYFWKELQKVDSRLEINGSLERRLPNNLNVYFPGRKAADLMIALDLKEVAVSSGSACSARSAKPSYVLEAMGLEKERCEGSLRFSLGRGTAKKEIDEVVKIIRRIVASE